MTAMTPNRTYLDAVALRRALLARSLRAMANMATGAADALTRGCNENDLEEWAESVSEAYADVEHAQRDYNRVVDAGWVQD